jgi:flagellar biosynthesis/type III secretory pathway protein FliH
VTGGGPELEGLHRPLRFPGALIDRWAYFFREAKNLSVVPSALSEDPFRGALEVARTATFSPEEWEAYERAKMAEQDARGALAVAREEGAAEGRRPGIAEGHRSGIAEGKRDALLRVLARRGIELTQENQQTIATCTDIVLLDRWLDNALTARTGAEVLD